MGNSMGIKEGRESEKRQKWNVQVCIAKSAHKQSLGNGCISSPSSLHTRQKNDWCWCICSCVQSLNVYIAFYHSLRTKIQLQLSLPQLHPLGPPVLKFPADSVAFSRPLSIITVLQTSSLYQTPKCTCKTGAQLPIHTERKLCSNCTPLWSQVLLVLSGLQDTCLEEEHCLREQADFKEASMVNPVPQEPETL